MSTNATIPFLDPKNPGAKPRDIPQAAAAAAVKAGYMPAVKFQTPEKNVDGSQKIRWIPADQTAAAYQAGGKLLPFEQQDMKHPGGWSALASDLWGMAKPMLTPPTSMQEVQQRSRLLGKLVGVSDPQEFLEAVQQNQDEEKAGYGPGYRYVAAPLARGIGANVSGMEQSAAEGDVGGVVGHAAAVPVATAITEGARAALPPAVSALSKSSLGPALKAGASAAPAMATPENIATGVAGAAGSYAGHFVGEPVGGGVIGAGVGRAFGKAFSSRLVDALAKKPEEFLDATGENKPFAGGMDEFTPKTKPAPRELDATGENKPFAGGFDEYLAPRPQGAPKLPGQAGQLAESVFGPQSTPQPAAAAAPAPAAAPGRVAPAPAAAQAPIAPRAPVSGEGALRAVLNNESHENLMSMADDRGIDTSHESQLAPAQAKPGLINKIVDDYSDDELDDFRDVYSFGGIENTPMKISQATPPPAAAAANALGDLTDILKKSVQVVDAQKNGAATTASASPKMLLNRWGVDPDSFVAGRAQTRGFSPTESAQQLQALEDRYRQGQPVDPVEEFRDADNNLIEVDGRGRALAAQRAGVERIPVIVRRASPTPGSTPAPAPTPTE